MTEGTGPLRTFRKLLIIVLRQKACRDSKENWVTQLRKVEPFVLRNKQLLPNEAAPKAWEVYDAERQLWVDARSGEPLVGMGGFQNASALPVTEFGETTLTKTAEGAD